MSKLIAKIYTLVYMLRAEGYTSHDSLVGPKTFTSEEEALECVWKYIKGRIESDCFEAFSEWAYDNLEGFAEYADSPEGEAAGHKGLIRQVSPWHYAEVADFFVGQMESEGYDCFYEISENTVDLSSIGYEITPTDSSKPLTGSITTHSNGLAASIKGYSRPQTHEEESSVIYLESRNDMALVDLFSDIYSLTPTYVVSLEAAKKETLDPKQKYFFEAETVEVLT
jgi:hypothetical protein